MRFTASLLILWLNSYYLSKNIYYGWESRKGICYSLCYYGREFVQEYPIGKGARGGSENVRGRPYACSWGQRQQQACKNEQMQVNLRSVSDSRGFVQGPLWIGKRGVLINARLVGKRIGVTTRTSAVTTSSACKSSSHMRAELNQLHGRSAIRAGCARSSFTLQSPLAIEPSGRRSAIAVKVVHKHSYVSASESLREHKRRASQARPRATRSDADTANTAAISRSRCSLSSRVVLDVRVRAIDVRAPGTGRARAAARR